MTKHQDTGLRRLLVIDDDPILRKLFEMRLQKCGFDVTTAENGEVARQLIEQQTFDAISVDLMMPVVDGVRFLKWLREEQQSDVPAIVFTSQDEQATLKKAGELGVQHVMSKPLDLPKFLAALDSMLNASCS